LADLYRTRQETARTPRNKTVILTTGMWMSPEELCTGPFMLSPPVPVIFPAEDDELRCVILGFLQIRTSLSCSLQVCIVCLQVKTLLRSLSLSLSISFPS